MKFSCYRNDLNEALQFVTKAVAVKPMTPVLSGIYLRAEDSILELQSNNFSTGITTRIPVNIDIPGEIVVVGKKFQEFVRGLADETLTVSDETGNNTLRLTSGNTSIELMTLETSDFPKVKVPDTQLSFSVNASMLRNLIRKTIFSVAKDETRPVFTGCAFEIENNKICLVATNTHRLSWAEGTLSDSSENCSFVVPVDTMRGIMSRIASNDDSNSIEINYSPRDLTFTFDNVFVKSRLIEGQFPPYDRVIPNSSTTRVAVNTADFKDAVDLVAIMSKENEYNTIKFVFADGNIEVSSNSPDVGGVIKNVDAQIDGEPLEISFNANYIIDALKVIDTPQLNIELNDRYSPAKFTEPENNQFVYVVTPVRA